jgi:hypothetical protein
MEGPTEVLGPRPHSRNRALTLYDSTLIFPKGVICHPSTHRTARPEPPIGQEAT